MSESPSQEASGQPDFLIIYTGRSDRIARSSMNGAAPQSRSSQQLAVAHANPDRVEAKDFGARQPSLPRSREGPPENPGFC